MTPLLHDNSICAADADKLIRAHDGDVALLYLYRLSSGCDDPEAAASALCRTLREIQAADEKLSRMGLSFSPSGERALTCHPAVPAVPAVDEVPQYTAEDVARRAREDEAFSVVLNEARKVMGRNLSSVDMKSILAIYDYIGLPSDVLLLMINFCGRQYEEKYHGQRRPTVRALQKEADLWARNEVVTLEQAESYMRRQDERRSRLHAVKALLGIHGRELSATEQDYIASWLDMGFDDACLSIAYDRTITNTGALKWSYMNRIMTSWHEKGLHTEKDVLEKDGKSRPANRSKRVGKAGNPMDFSSLDTMIDKI